MYEMKKVTLILQDCEKERCLVQKQCLPPSKRISRKSHHTDCVLAVEEGVRRVAGKLAQSLEQNLS